MGEVTVHYAEGRETLCGRRIAYLSPMCPTVTTDPARVTCKRCRATQVFQFITRTAGPCEPKTEKEADGG